MFTIKNYLRPASLQEAYDVLRTVPGAVVLGGCGYLRLAGRKIENALDLSGLGLDEVCQNENEIEIGAMVSLRRLETEPLLQEYASALLGQAVAPIVGIQLRNCVTIGGSVMGRYPFSDPITALLALDAQLEFFAAGRISLEEYLAGKGFKDILCKIIIPRKPIQAAYQSVRKSATDYAILNCAVACVAGKWRVVVGSRPGRSQRSLQAEEFLNNSAIDSEKCAEAGRLAAAELSFGDNPRGTARYRGAICPVLVKRALMEVVDAGNC